MNAFIFKGRHNITLLDTGTMLTKKHLKQGFSELGLEFADVDRIVLTHGHVDHYGGAGSFLSRSNPRRACVYAHKEDIRAIQVGAEATAGAYLYFLKHAGTPAATRVAISTLFLMFQRLSRGCKVDHALQDGAYLTMGDYDVKVISTPGHTRGSVCFYLEKEKMLFSGDHVLSHITPNALVMLEEKKTLPRRMSQCEYYNSLETIAMLDPKIIHPAHGNVIRDFKSIHDSYKKSYFIRQKRILEEIRNAPGQTIDAMAHALFRQVNRRGAVLDLFLAISEIYTHIQVLEADGLVHMEIKNNRIHVESK